MLISLFNSRHFKISADVLIMSVSRFIVVTRSIHGDLHETTESASKNDGEGYFKLYFYKNITVRDCTDASISYSKCDYTPTPHKHLKCTYIAILLFIYKKNILFWSYLLLIAHCSPSMI